MQHVPYATKEEYIFFIPAKQKEICRNGKEFQMWPTWMQLCFSNFIRKLILFFAVCGVVDVVVVGAVVS